MTATSERSSFATRTATALCAGAAIIVGATLSYAQAVTDIIVTYDQSQLLPLPRPVSEIIIGNPLIADVSVRSKDLLVITGKSFGITNMIALDSNRQIIFEKRLQVRREEARVVNLQRGALRQTYNCTPQCNPTITVGDDAAYFDATLKASEKKNSISEKAADGVGASGN